MFWQMLSIAIQCSLALAVIVFTWRAMRLFTAELPAARMAPPDSAMAGGLAEVLAVVSRVLSEHADELGLFERSLHARAHEPQGQFADLERQIGRVRSANHRVEQTVEDTVANLVAACGQLLSAEQSRLQTYRAQTRNFDQTLSAVSRESLLADIATRLLGMVQELGTENCNVRQELVAVRERVTGLKAQAQAAEQMARVDALTQLPNRRGFDAAYALAEESLQRTGQPFALVILDVDHFKDVNDCHGHTAGDAVLSMIGRVLLENRRPHEHVSRLGGEEFALLLTNCDVAAALHAAERYRQKIGSAKLQYQGQHLAVTVSGGVAVASPHDSKQVLLQRADTALYAAKAGGRNQVFVYDESLADTGVAVPEPATVG
jgi:diguanylate cyclase